jgi:3-hydroxyisobutyrate dehydrogenase
MRVAVLGTGTMGAPITRRLAAAGHAVRAWNRTPEKAEGLGAEVCDGPAEAAAGAEVLLTILADGPAVEETMRHASPALDQGAIWAQLSTVGVAWAERFAETAAERRVLFVDAPVMGSHPAAEEGTLLPLASGPEEARERVTEVLETFSRRVLWLGPGRLGSRLKLVANHWIFVAVDNLAECLDFAEALGLEPARLLEAISGAPFDMQYAHWKGKLVLEREFPPAFALRLARKDAGLMLEAAREAGLELPLLAATAERFDRAIGRGHGDEDVAAVYYASSRLDAGAGSGAAAAGQG